LLHLVKLSNFIQQLAGFLWVCNPRGGACQSSLEVVCPGAQKLVTNVQCLAALDASEDALTGENSPGLVPDIDEYIITTCSIH
jgi:hypothetical protein